MTADGDLVTALRVIASLVAVLVLVVLAARFARRTGLSGSGLGLRVVDRVGLTRETAVAVVEVAGRGFVVGAGSQGVTVLAELEPGQLEAARRERRPAGRGRVNVTRVVAPEPGQDRPAGAPAGVPVPRTSPSARSTPSAASAGTGAVLDPRTWRQAVDALRDLTVRRR